MKRWPFTILLFLLLGVVVNLAVATICVHVTAEFESDFKEPTPREQIAWDKRFGSSLEGPFSPEVVHQGWRFGMAVEAMTDYPGQPSIQLGPPHGLSVRYNSPLDVADFRILTAITTKSGWPLLAFEADQLWRYDGTAASGNAPMVVRNGILTDRDRPPFASPGIDPFGPIWVGVIGNSIFYAVLLWLIAWGSFALRRHIRKRHRCCIKCGYPAGASATCTECGTAVSVRRKRA